MPILTSQSAATAKSQDGKVHNLAPRVALQMTGPLIPVLITVEQSVAQQLAQQGLTLPNPIAGIALVDTGASVTCIDEEVAKALGIAPIDVVQMHSASHAGVQCNVYPVSFLFTQLNIGRSVPRAMGAALKAQGLVMLIGRDILAQCTFHYNGSAGTFELAL